MLETDRQWMQYATVGTEFAVTFAVFLGLGLAVDRAAGTLPAFTLVGMVLGFAGALYRLIRAVLGAGRSGAGTPPATPDDSQTRNRAP